MHPASCIILSLLLLPLLAQAQRVPTDFVTLSPQRYAVKPGDGRLPLWHAQIDVGEASCAERAHRVAVEYPEWQPLSADEAALIRRQGWPVADTITLCQSLGFARSRALLEVSLCPIVRRSGRLWRLTSFKLDCTALPLAPPARRSADTGRAPGTTRWAEHSLLAEGHWEKISVSADGVYQLTPAALAKMGFTDPQRVNVYGYGGRVIEEDFDFVTKERTPDDLSPVAVLRRGDGSLLFWANGTLRTTLLGQTRRHTHAVNPYATRAYYFLTDSQPPLTLSPQQTASPALTGDLQQVGQVPGVAVVDNDRANFYQGGREMYDEHDFQTAPSHTFRLDAPSLVQGTAQTLEVGFAAASKTPTTVKMELAGQALGSLTVRAYGANQSAYEARRSLQTELFRPGQNDLKITTPAAVSARLNYLRLSYERQLSAADAPFAFQLGQAAPARAMVTSADEHTQLWRLPDADQPGSIVAPASLEGSVLSAPLEAAAARYCIVNTAASWPEPKPEGTVQNQDLHATGPIDMLIVVPESATLHEQAQRLAAFRREHDSLRVLVATTQQLYNEFSSGTPDASAPRRMLKMLYDRAAGSEAGMPRYLLLFGPSLWDNRMLATEHRNLRQADYLPAFEVTDRAQGATSSADIPLGEVACYVTDDFYGWLDDGEGTSYTAAKIDLGIGRLPCATEQQARTAVDKIIAYAENREVGSWKNQLCFLADYGDSNQHMEDAETVIGAAAQAAADRLEVSRVYWDRWPCTTTAVGNRFPQATQSVLRQMEQGALVFNYSGHGSPNQISHAGILFKDDFLSTKSRALPLWVFASCEISPFDRPGTDIARAALLNPAGGAMAVVSASRSVYSSYNRDLNARLMSHLLSPAVPSSCIMHPASCINQATIGDALLASRGGGMPRPLAATIGDALRQAKVDMLSSTAGGTDYTINKLKYALLGDPSQRLMLPTLRAVVDSIAGQALASGARPALAAGQLVRISGHIETAPAQRDHSFRGTVSARIADRMETVTCVNNKAGASGPMTYRQRTSTVFEAADSVASGSFSFCFRVPTGISYSQDPARVSLYAVTADHQREANGYCEQFSFGGGTSLAEADTLPPKICLYLDTPDFPDGSLTGPSPLLVARLSDDAGLAVLSEAGESDIELVLDARREDVVRLNPYFQYDFGSYRAGTALYPLSGLQAGRHTLSVSGSDVSGNRTTATLHFVVRALGLPAADSTSFCVSATDNPARTHTTLVLTLPESLQQSPARLRVYTTDGALVWQTTPQSANATSRYRTARWPLTTSAGAPVPTGVYLLQAVAGSRETKAEKIIVLRQ